MLAYVKLKKLFKKLDRNVKNITVLSVKGNLLYLIVTYLISFDICVYISNRINAYLGSVILFFVPVILVVWAVSNKAGLGIRDDGLLIVLLKRFKIEDKKIYNVPFDKIRSITVSKFGLKVNLKLSFISEEGVLEKKKYSFSTFILGSEEQKKSSKLIYERLIEVQKVIDKGDF